MKNSPSRNLREREDVPAKSAKFTPQLPDTIQQVLFCSRKSGNARRHSENRSAQPRKHSASVRLKGVLMPSQRLSGCRVKGLQAVVVRRFKFPRVGSKSKGDVPHDLGFRFDLALRWV